MSDTSLSPAAPYEAFILSRVPAWLRQASPEQRERLRRLALDADAARQTLKQASQALPVVRALALEHLRPMLAQWLPGNVQPDPCHAVLRWVDPAGKRPVLQQTLLAAALLNFHVRDTQASAYGEGSGLFAGVTAGGQADLNRPLRLPPHTFARECRALNLGERLQEALALHIPRALPGPHEAVTATPSFAWKVLQAQRKAFMADACVGRLNGQLGGQGEALLAHLQLAPGAPAPGVAAQAQRLTLLGFPLARALVFSRLQANQAYPVVAYLPGAPEGSVVEYASARAFVTALGARLKDAQYLKFFSGFVPLERRLAFIQRVRQASASGGWRPGRLTWEPVPVTGDPFVDGYRVWAQQTLAEAATLAVPTEQLDHRDTFERYAGWVEVGEQVGTSLALIVGSALPGINLVADAIMVAQAVHSVYEGARAWQHGDSQSALECLFGAVENAGFLGLGKRPEPSKAALDFAAGLVPVTAADGQVRLWRPDLDDFRARDLPPQGVLPDESGVYRHAGRAWLRIQGQTHEVAADSTARSARLLHPDGEGYTPLLHGDGSGGWRGAHEEAGGWDTLTLIRRFNERYEALPPATLLEAQRLADISDAQLQAAHREGSGMPAPLAHLLAQRLAEQQLALTLTVLRGTHRFTQPAAALVDALRSIPGWPPEKALEYHDGNAAIVFGPAESGQRIQLERAALMDGSWAARLLAQLAPEALDALLGAYSSQVPAAPAHAHLAERWATALEQRRLHWVQRLAEPAPSHDPGRQTLLRQFPGLVAECVDALMRGITTAQRTALSAGRVPVAMAEQAAEALRQLRLMRALDALAGGNASVDRDRLVFALLPRLGPWANSIRLELHANVIGGTLLQASGGTTLPGWVIVRRGVRYQAFTRQGLELSPWGSLEDAIFAALPREVRAAAPGIEHGPALRRALLEYALGAREMLRPLLGMVRDNRRFFRPPRRHNGATGYALSGRGRVVEPSPLGDRLQNGLRLLYPTLSAAELGELRAGLGEGEAAVGELARLMREDARLRGTLGDWVARAADHPNERLGEIEAQNRTAVMQEILAAWQRRPSNRIPGGAGYTLTLRGLPVSELPELALRFDHVHRLALIDMELSRVSEAFIANFPNLTWLDLSLNTLTALPGLAGLPRLERLSLDYTGVHPLSEVVEAAMPVAAHLRHLDLAGVHLNLAPADFGLLRQFPSLIILDLEGNQITLTEDTAGGFDTLPQLQDLSLSGNPLQRAPVVAHLRDLVLFEAGNCDLTQFPPGLADLMNHDPVQLREINLSQNGIVELPDLEHTRFVQLAREMGHDIEAEHDGPRLNLNANPLSPQALAMVRRTGMEVFAQPDESPGSAISEGEREEAEGWLLGCPAPLYASIQAERTAPEAAEFYALLSRLVDTADYRRAPQQERQRAWDLVSTWLSPGEQALPGLDELRQRLFALAEGIMGTCGDGVAITLDDMELEVQAWRIVAGSTADGDGPLRELLDFQRRLWRRVLVDDLARRIVRARVARREGLALATLDGPPAPALDPLDDLPDARLEDGIDEVEVRLYLLQQLQATLNLPVSRSMRYVTQVSPRTIQQVGAQVQALDSTEAFAAWVAEREGFRASLEHARAQVFDAERERWQEAADYLYSLGGEAQAAPGAWPAVLGGLREVLPDARWPVEGQGAPRLNEQELRTAYDWVSQQRRARLAAIALRLTRQLLGLEAPGSSQASR